MKVNFLVLPVLLLLSGVTTLFAAEKTAKPNIVIFLIDDLGWADVGWHGTEIKTPNLDKLADSGIKLEQFYVRPLCSPTRASLLTGRYPLRYGLQQHVIWPWSDYGLPTDERTLADALHETGYYTAIVGKWHLGVADKKYHPLQRGFDHHYGLYNWGVDYYEHTYPGMGPGRPLARQEGTRPEAAGPDFFGRNIAGGFDWHRNGKTVREEGYSTDLIGKEAAGLVKNHDTAKPLFLYVPFNGVHSPYQEAPDKELNAQYENLNGVRKIYAGMVSSVDSNVGRIVKALEEKGILDNTVIFFSSDNGGPQPKVVTDNGPLRGEKATVYEGGVRVPAFVVWPGKIKPNTASHQAFHIVDLYPTLLGIAGASLEQKHPLDGVDIKDALLEDKPLSRKEILLYSIPRGGAIRVGDWKLVINGGSSFRFGQGQEQDRKTELFNIKEDPYEKNDLAASNPEKLQELLERYEVYVKESVPPLEKPVLELEVPKNFKTPEVWGEEPD
ncbi:MAG: arylsulfatase [Planctomycetaceae bacterium]|jgi:arylsulfatase A-like enzyme|nr:arylsulfatase [Planctomycetaceae bacterium]